MEQTQRAGGYIRVENGANDKEGIEAQKFAIKSFAENKGIDLLDIYIEQNNEDVSLDKREGYAKLNNDIVSGKINTVIAFSFDRLTDDNREKQGLMHNFAEKGVEIYIASTSEHINPSNPITKEQRLLAQAMRDTETARAEIVRDRLHGNEETH